METKTLRILMVVAAGVTTLWAQTSQAQQVRPPFPPPPPVGSGTGATLNSGTLPPPPPPIGSGTGSILKSGSLPPPPPPINSGTGTLVSGTLPPPPPPIGSGTGTLVSGTNFPPPPPPNTSGTLNVSGTNLPPPPPPPQNSGTDNPSLSGSNTPPPPPPQSGDAPQNAGAGTPPLPGTSIESLTDQLSFAYVGSGSSGSVKGVFTAVSTSGTYYSTLNIVCGGLTTGTYALSATLLDSTSVSIGTFVIGGTNANPGAKPPKGPQKVAFGGKNGVPFPTDLNPLDIASLTISDTSSNPLYTADLTAISDGCWMAHIAIDAGDGAPDAEGFVDMLAKVKKGTVTGCIAIHARNLPASTTYTYSIDGTDLGTLATTNKGTLNFKVATTLDLITVKTLAVHDASSTVIFSAAF